MYVIDFSRLQVGQIVRDRVGIFFRITKRIEREGHPIFQGIDVAREQTVVQIDAPANWTLVEEKPEPPKAKILKVIEDIPVPTVATNYVRTFQVPTEVDGDVLVIDNKGRRMVVEPDGGFTEGGDDDFSVTLFSACNASRTKTAHAFMKSMMGRRVRVTVEVLED